MANTLQFKDLSLILTDIIKYGSGDIVTTPVDTSSFVQVGQKALQMGYDNILKGLSIVLSKTIFPTRNYQGSFNLLLKDNTQWGLHTRKITFLDDEPKKDATGKTVDGVLYNRGDKVDRFTWNPAKVIQTNFYGGNTYMREIMLTDNQLDAAFRNHEEFGHFISSLYTHLGNQIVQDKDLLARNALCNLIAGKIAKDSAHVYKLVTEYKQFIGDTTTTFNLAHIIKIGKLADFYKYVVGRVNEISKLMEVRTTMYHQNFTDGKISRFTPKVNQKAYFNANHLEQIKTNVLSTVFNSKDVQLPAHESIAFWQDVKNPLKINVTPSVLDSATGNFVKNAKIENNLIFGVLFDEEAIGMTLLDEKVLTTPLNEKARIANVYAHYTLKYFNDFTENVVVFTLE